MSINLSALQSKQSGAAQRDMSVVQLLWCSRAVSTAQDCCVTTSAILVTLHFQLMLISHAKGPFDPVQKRSWWDAARMQFQGSDLFSLMTCLFIHSSRLFVLTFANFQLYNSVQIDEVITWAVLCDTWKTNVNNETRGGDQIFIFLLNYRLLWQMQIVDPFNCWHLLDQVH